MQRSLVQEYRSSSPYSARSLKPSSSKQPTPSSLYLHRSRVSHPPERNLDMTNKLDFVVVFQTAQIMRLNEELSILRNKVRQFDNRQEQVGYYEVQIRELMQRCSQLEHEKFSYLEQLSQTRDASDNIYHELSLLRNRYAEVDFCVAEKYKLEQTRNEELSAEVDRWKQRYGQLERSKAQQVDGYKKMVESRRQALAGRENQEAVNRMENEREELMARLKQKKEQLDEKELQLKKMTNWYEQAKVREKEDQAKIDQYQEKVALLSQETIRLGALNKVKNEEVRQRRGEAQMSLRRSRIKETEQKLMLVRVQDLEQEAAKDKEEIKRVNRELREAHDEVNELKLKKAELDRTHFELKEIKQQSERRLKAMERKDKKLIALEQDLKEKTLIGQQIPLLKEKNEQLTQNLANLQNLLQMRTKEIIELRQRFSELSSRSTDHERGIVDKIGQFDRIFEQLQRDILQSVENRERSQIIELEIQEVRSVIREKQYNQQRVKTEFNDMENRLRQTENLLQAQRRENQIRKRDLQSRLHELSSRNHQLSSQSHEFESKTQQMAMRNNHLSSDINELDSRNKDLTLLNNQLSSQIHELETKMLEKASQNGDLRNLLRQVAEEQHQLTNKHMFVAQEMTLLQQRLNTIEKILYGLKDNLMQKLLGAKQQEQRLKNVEEQYERMLVWLSGGILRKDNSGFLDQMSPYKNKSYSPDRVKGQNSSLESIPPQFLLKYVLLCAEVEALRKKVGDKQAKMESMRSHMTSNKQVDSMPSQIVTQTRVESVRSHMTSRSLSPGPSLLQIPSKVQLSSKQSIPSRPSLFY